LRRSKWGYAFFVRSSVWGYALFNVEGTKMHDKRTNPRGLRKDERIYRRSELKKVTALVFVLGMLLSLCACGTSSQPNIQAGNTAEPTISSSAESTNAPEAATTEIEDVISDVPDEITNVFPELFRLAATWVGNNDYDSCLQAVKDTGFEYETTAPSNDDIGKISLEDGNGFVLNMHFYPDNSNHEILTLLSYSDGNYEGSVSDNYHMGSVTFGTYDVNADPKHSDVANVDEIIQFIMVDVPQRKEDYDNSVQGNTELEVTLDVSYEIQNGKVFFIVNTNLPDKTELMLTLSNSVGFRAQTKVTIENGTAKSEGFSNKGEPLSGSFDLAVTMSLPRLQSENVVAVIGSNGEFLTGPYVVESSIGSSNVVEGSFSFSF